MNETELKHIIALLLEDARQLYRLAPGSATLARIQMAEKALKQGKGSGISKFSAASKNEVIEINSNISDSVIASSHKTILMGARLLEVITSELEKNGIKPTPDYLECVLNVIAYSTYRR
ncbi:TPA: hypothetical protein KC759_000014 [Escherichia coli O146]|nr:hypothetical protein [Escherichia coli O146]HBC3062768.1 hypothetical protein [Escherichia coli O146]HBC3157621.1 hypothetical protein [Escherichia coli O146]